MFPHFDFPHTSWRRRRRREQRISIFVLFICIVQVLFLVLYICSDVFKYFVMNRPETFIENSGLISIQSRNKSMNVARTDPQTNISPNQPTSFQSLDENKHSLLCPWCPLCHAFPQRPWLSLMSVMHVHYDTRVWSVLMRPAPSRRKGRVGGVGRRIGREVRNWNYLKASHVPRRQITMETAGVCIFLLPSPVGRNLLAKCPVSFQQVSGDATVPQRKWTKE